MYKWPCWLLIFFQYDIMIFMIIIKEQEILAEGKMLLWQFEEWTFLKSPLSEVMFYQNALPFEYLLQILRNFLSLSKSGDFSGPQCFPLRWRQGCLAQRGGCKEDQARQCMCILWSIKHYLNTRDQNCEVKIVINLRGEKRKMVRDRTSKPDHSLWTGENLGMLSAKTKRGLCFLFIFFYRYHGLPYLLRNKMIGL